MNTTHLYLINFFFFAFCFCNFVNAQDESIKTLTGHSKHICSVSFSPDGKYIASASQDGSVKLWEVLSGQCIKTFLRDYRGWPMSVSFSPDEKYIASSYYDGAIRLWNVLTEECEKTFTTNPDNSANNVSFSLDGKYIVCGYSDKTVKLWNLLTGQLGKIFSGSTGSINSVSFSPDGKYIASNASSYFITLWDVLSGLPIKDFADPKEYSLVSSVTYSPDGKYIASCTYNGELTIRLWNITTGQCVNRFSGHTAEITSVSFSPDGKYIASGSKDHTVKLWDVQTGQCLKTFSGHSTDVKAVSFCPDGKYIASAAGNNIEDNTVKLWDVSSYNIKPSSTLSSLSLILSPKPKAPANLVITDIGFNDHEGNNNNILDGNEHAEVKFLLSNQGKGDGFNIVVEIHETDKIRGIKFTDRKTIGNLAAGKEVAVNIPVAGTMQLETGKSEFEIIIKEANGFDADPFKIAFNTEAFKYPTIALADYKFTSNEEGKIKLGSTVSLNIVVQNQGQGDASDINISFVNPVNVFPGGESSFNINKLKPNESKNFNYEFFANKKYTGIEIPIQVIISEIHKKYGVDKTLSISLEQTLAKTQLVNVDGQHEKQVQIDKVSLTSDVDRDIPVNTVTNPHRYTLVIGNEDYTKYQTNLSSESNVAFAASDAGIFAAYCEKTLGVQHENITLLQNAIGSKMKQEVDKLTKLIQYENGNAEVIFYYAGHGFPDEATKESYIMPVDISGANVTDGIKLSDLYQKLTINPVKRVSVFLDACFSGGGRDAGLLAARSVKIKPKANSVTGNLLVMSASSGEQSSLPYKEKQHGMFTYYLLKKLQETKGDVLYKDLFDYVKQQVELNSIKVNGKDQNPQLNYSSAIDGTWEEWKLKK